MSQSYARGNQGPPGTLSIKEIEVDFGNVATRSKNFVISDVMITSGSKVAVFQSGNPATGRQADEAEMDQFVCAAYCRDGNFILMANTVRGPVKGLYKLLYIVS